MVIFTIILQASGPKEGNGIMPFIILMIIVFAIVFMVYRKSKLVRNLTLLHSMRNNGPNSLATIGALDNVVRDMLKSDGVTVLDLKIVHEIGNRYKAILTAGGKTYDMSIIADKAGNVQYRIN